MVNAVAAVIYLAMLASDAFCSAELDRLLALHDSYGLPHPPKDASLVMFVARNSTGGFYERWISRFSPAFGFSRDGKTVLNELGNPVEVRSIETVVPDATFKDDVQLGWFVDAIQYHARGWKPLARATFRKWMWRNSYYWEPNQKLLLFAWHHWKRRLHHDPNMPLVTIAKRLKQIPEHIYETSPEERRKLLASLDLSLKPSNSRPGSDDALIDALIEARGREPLESWNAKGFRQDPRYRALLRRGFDAVPALIAHLSDDRLTRCYWDACGSDDRRVKDIVFDILMQLNGGPIFDGWRGGLDNGVPKEWREEIGNWYADADKLGEEKFILSRMFGDEEDDEQFRPGLLYLLAEKYPKHLPEVFRKAIDTRKEHARFAWDYAKAVAEARLPDADKRKILEYAAKHKQPTVRAAGIYYLRQFDPKVAKEQLLVGLAEIGANPGIDEAALAFIVAEGTDADEWKALARAVRLNVGRQIDLISAVLCAKTREGQKYRLAFLTEYLIDELNTDAPAGRAAQAEVRHIAAIQLAGLLTIETKPYPMDWAAGLGWEELRDAVKAELWP